MLYNQADFVDDGYISCKETGNHWWEPNEVGGKECLECGLREGPQPYGMGTKEETFRLNWKHFGLKRALYRKLERFCCQEAGKELMAWQNNSSYRHNFVLYTPPWYWKPLCKLEFFLRKFV